MITILKEKKKKKKLDLFLLEDEETKFVDRISRNGIGTNFYTQKLKFCGNLSSFTTIFSVFPHALPVGYSGSNPKSVQREGNHEFTPKNKKGKSPMYIVTGFESVSCLSMFRVVLGNAIRVTRVSTTKKICEKNDAYREWKMTLVETQTRIN